MPLNPYRWLRLAALVPMLLAGAARADQRHDFFLAASVDNGYWLGKMLQQGVDPNMHEEQRGDTALILALREHAMHAFAALLADPRVDVEARAGNGDSALMIASYTENEPAVAALLEKGAAVNPPANQSGWTALHYAAAAGNYAIVKRLLDKSAWVDARSPNGTTPLMMAARSGHTHVIQALLDAGADVALKNEQGIDALEMALQHEQRGTAEQLRAVMGAGKP